MIRLSFIGDISLNDDYVDSYRQGKKPFKGISSLLKDSDLVIGNLECMAAGEEGENQEKRPRLKTTVETLNYLRDFRLNLALLANNHIYDNLRDGFSKTVSFLDKAGISYLGASGNPDKDPESFSLILQGKRLIFLNYVTPDTHLNMSADAGVRVSEYAREKVVREIMRFRQECDYLILCLHWGGKMEGAFLPERCQRKDAKAFIEAGADLIVGHHSHILYPYEKYKGKHIFYSLGNFCFSDIHFEGKLFPILKKRGYSDSAILHISLEEESITAHLQPIKNRQLEIIPAENFPVRFRVMQKLFFLLMLPPFWDIYFYWHTRMKDWIYHTKIFIRKKLKLG